MVENVFEAMADPVLVVNASGQITMANSAASQLTGFSLEQLRKIPIAKLIVDDSSGLKTLVRQRIGEGEVLRKQESWLVTHTGEKIPVSITGSPLGGPEDFQGIVLVARDIREIRLLLVEKENEILRRRFAEEELRAAKASIEQQLEQTRTQLLLAERRATLGTLAGGVGHELRNIAQIQVAAVDELSAAIQAGEDLTKLAATALLELERVGEHITEHGNRLMRLARPGPDRIAPFNLNTVVLEVVVMLQAAGKLRHIEIVTSFGSDHLIVTVNRTRIEQILVNLVVNAVDAIGKERGKIQIHCRSSPDGSRVITTVTDSGCGIPRDQLDRIFEPFFTTKSEHGTGLGLPVAKEIVQSYGGQLLVESTIGVGTSFTFDLPC
ncbi:MAG: nitrogen regulation protein NR(II) [Kofleriaceae bacterium]